MVVIPNHNVVIPNHTVVVPNHTVVIPNHTVVIPNEVRDHGFVGAPTTLSAFGRRSA
jgi:hypothetical protein